MENYKEMYEKVAHTINDNMSNNNCTYCGKDRLEECQHENGIYCREMHGKPAAAGYSAAKECQYYNQEDNKIEE